MLKTFIISFKLRITYVVNNIIYSIKQIPLLGKEISSDCYSSKPIKAIGTILAVVNEIFWNILFKKFMYFAIMFLIIPFVVQSILYDDNIIESKMNFASTFIFLTFIGGMINNHIFSTSKDKYYAIFTMNIDTKKYVITNYIYEIIKNLIVFYPFIILFSNLIEFGNKLSNQTILILPMIMVFTKSIFSCIRIKYFEKTRKVEYGNLLGTLKIILIIVLFIAAYALPLLEIGISNIGILFIFIITTILGIFSIIKIFKFRNYKMMYKKLFAEEDEIKIDFKVNQKEQALEQISTNTKDTSRKEGYAFFNEIFVKRHKKILGRVAKVETIIILIIVAIILILIQVLQDQEMKEGINNFLLQSLPHFTYIMFLLNAGTTVTQAMFMNCDHSMLTYKFYRTPKAILGLFKERLKTLISINIVPAIIMAISLPVLLFATGGTDNNLNYIIMFVSIIAMSVFFSTHYLVIYYLLQPYNIEAEMKSAMYRIIIIITYIVCYEFINLELEALIFGTAITGFSIAYIFVSLILVYKFAPKTFKLRK